MNLLLSLTRSLTIYTTLCYAQPTHFELFSTIVTVIWQYLLINYLISMWKDAEWKMKHDQNENRNRIRAFDIWIFVVVSHLERFVLVIDLCEFYALRNAGRFISCHLRFILAVRDVRSVSPTVATQGDVPNCRPNFFVDKSRNEPTLYSGRGQPNSRTNQQDKLTV